MSPPAPTLAASHSTAATKPSTPTAKRFGAALWAIAQKKSHAYHQVSHELQHRAQEKAFFGLCEHMLGRLVIMCSAEHGADALAHGAQALAHGVVAGRGRLGKAVRSAAGWVRRAAARIAGRGARRQPPPPPPSRAAVARELAVRHGLHGLHVAIPLAGTYLIAHMARHDFARARREWREVRAVVATALFYVGAVCDGLDALAHAAIVCGHTLFHIDHGVEHTLHEASMAAAVVACVAMMLGETISAYCGHGHAHSEHGAHAGQLAANERGPLPGAPSLHERMKAAGLLTHHADADATAKAAAAAKVAAGVGGKQD